MDQGGKDIFYSTDDCSANGGGVAICTHSGTSCNSIPNSSGGEQVLLSYQVISVD